MAIFENFQMLMVYLVIHQVFMARHLNLIVPLYQCLSAFAHRILWLEINSYLVIYPLLPAVLHQSKRDLR
jgi:hypothetical protein